ncbi:MAG TPA: hypothetical protein ENG16_02845, partial [Archaeoglobus sp.]|nr:hypothetical protein [Archaeoglobus sp.]
MRKAVIEKIRMLAEMNTDWDLEILKECDEEIEAFKIKAEDFPDDADVLFDLGVFLLRKGETYGLKNFLRLSVDLFIRVRNFVSDEDYARALVGEGNARLRLAEMGIDAKDNLRKAVKLYEKSRNI